MAFAANQTINTALFRNLFFRTSDNAPISSYYSMNTNGRGTVGWTKSVAPSELSSLSGQIATTSASYSQTVSSLVSSFDRLSTFTLPVGFSTYQGFMNSTFGSQGSNVSTLSGQFTGFNNQQITQSNALQTALVFQTNAVYLSSLTIAQSSVVSLQNPATFGNQISSLYSTMSHSLSTLSTAIYTTGSTTYSFLSSLITLEFDTDLVAEKTYTDNIIGLYSNILPTTDKLVEFSTQYGILESTSLYSLTSSYTSEYTTQIEYISSLQSSYTNVFNAEITSLQILSTLVPDLSTFTTTLSTVILTQVSTMTGPLFENQDTKFSKYYSTAFDALEPLSTSAGVIFTGTEDFLNLLFFTNTVFISTYSTILDSISSLSQEVYSLNMSSILGNVYNTFTQFEQFTNEIVISTSDSVAFLESTVAQSSAQMMISTTSTFYSTLFSDSFYTSTINTVSTVIRNELVNYATTQFIAGSEFVYPSTQSTFVGKTNQYNSLVNNLYIFQLATFGSRLNSTNQAILSTHTGQLLSTVSTLGQIQLSTFRRLGVSSIQGQVNLFSTQMGTQSSLQSTLFQTQVSTNSSFQSTFLTTSTLYNALFSTMRTSTVIQQSTISSLFVSSLAGFSSQFGTLLPSTAAGYVAEQTFDTQSAIGVLVPSTVQTYLDFIEPLAASISTLAFSTLYTEQQWTLSGSNFVAILDFQRFTNFYINVYDPLLSGTTSSYRITYNSNSVSSLLNKTGIITLNVSTPTSAYTNLNGRLWMDLYGWGLPTTIWNELYPSISTANYTEIYEYIIQDNTVYTNLLNAYPRIAARSLTLHTSTNTGVSTSFWRGSPVTVSWSNFYGYPFTSLQLPAYRVETLVDVVVSNQAVGRFGPYDQTVSTATITLPSFSGTLTNPISTAIRSYIVGNPTQYQELYVNTVMPTLSYITITASTNRFLSFADLAANTATGSNTLSSVSRVFSFDGSGSNAGYEIQAYRFAGTSNSFVSIPNTAALRVGTGDFTVEWYQNLTDITNYPSTMTVFGIGTQPALNFGLALHRGVPGTLRLNAFMNGVSINAAGALLNLENSDLYWRHLSITRRSGSLFFSVDGQQSGPITATQNITDAVNTFTIGKETNGTSLTAFQGHITNFHFVNGTALYGLGNFTPPARPIQSVTNTALLLRAANGTGLAVDSSPIPKPVTISNIAYTRFGKENAIDGNPSTYYIGPSTISSPSAFTQFRVEPALETTLTNVSSILLRNLPIFTGPTRSYNINHDIYRESVYSFNDLEGAVMEFGVITGSNIHKSTIQLRSSQIQAFTL